MPRTLALFAILIAATFLASAAVAEDAKQGVGKVAGSVVDAAGNAVAGVPIRLMAPRNKDAAAAAKDPVPADGVDPRDRPKPEPVATATTDGQGKFEMGDVAPGKYVVVAAQKGVGRARQQVDVKANETTSVVLTLEKRDKQK